MAKNYVESLNTDFVDQFRDKPNIKALAEVLAEQLQDVYEFYEQLRNERDLMSAVGKQLDGVGDIVELTRMQAGLLAGDPIPYDVIEDEDYRKLLIFKVLKNTTNATYPDIVKAFKMFWDLPLYYSEDPDQPATMVFDTGDIEGAVDTTPLFKTPLIRAAGVTLKLYARTSNQLEPVVIRVGSRIGCSVVETNLPTVERDISYHSQLNVAGGVTASVMDTPLSDISTAQEEETI